MAVSIVGKGLGMIAAVAPVAVVTPAVIIENETQQQTYRLLAESSDKIQSENGDYIRSE